MLVDRLSLLVQHFFEHAKITHGKHILMVSPVLPLFFNSWPKFHQVSAERSQSRSRISDRPRSGSKPGCCILIPVRAPRGGGRSESYALPLHHVCCCRAAGKPNRPGLSYPRAADVMHLHCGPCPTQTLATTAAEHTWLMQGMQSLHKIHQSALHPLAPGPRRTLSSTINWKPSPPQHCGETMKRTSISNKEGGTASPLTPTRQERRMRKRRCDSV